ncbi:MAG TPA: [Fe-Fe] hydrogenase large subunit C-terminal domain-containing protein [Smithellaceae bacterium]|nr:[Fe-Fe] hydrogenase large subunit C-terminal domain-containing protein [Smithellaceae bacterium]
MTEPVIITNPARCRDCYRCVRHCDVKAIRVQDGQAQVVPELCIVCGTCIRTCPQKAKDVQSSTPDVQKAIREGRKVIASIAPAAPAYFDFHSFSEMETALKKLGFTAAEETALGAEMVGLAHREYIEQTPVKSPVITSSCPVIVNLIEKYYPDLIPHLAPVVSPMIAHGRRLRQTYGPDAFVVFIGPCIAKKMEIADPSVSGAISAVMTFRGLAQWLEAERIVLSAETGQDLSKTHIDARLFPVEGGLVGTAGLSTDMLGNDFIVSTGLDTCCNILSDIRTGQLNAKLVELMACPGGCVNGPAMADLQGGIYASRQKILAYHRNRPAYGIPHRDSWPDLSRTYSDKHQTVPEFSEDQIQEVLRRVNKYTKDDELNCGACGYSSCREKAIATLRGMAELTMCIPYMRSRAESLRQVVMDVSPNSIIILDDHLSIQDLSPSAEHLFGCSLADFKGKHISRLIPLYDDFISVRDTGQPVLGRFRKLTDRLTVEQNIVQVEGQKLLVAIMRDITERELEKQQFRQLRAETLEKTREVVRKQMRVAHEIAHLLGETTAESKMIVTHLAKLLEEEESK